MNQITFTDFYRLTTQGRISPVLTVVFLLYHNPTKGLSSVNESRQNVRGWLSNCSLQTKCRQNITMWFWFSQKYNFGSTSSTTWIEKTIRFILAVSAKHCGNNNTLYYNFYYIQISGRWTRTELSDSLHRILSERRPEKTCRKKHLGGKKLGANEWNIFNTRGKISYLQISARPCNVLNVYW